MVPVQRWFPANEALRDTAYEKLLPPLVAKIETAVANWRADEAEPAFEKHRPATVAALAATVTDYQG